MMMIFVVTSLAVLVCMTAGEPSVPCTKPDNGDRYFVSDKQQCDRFHMCDETGKLAVEFLCEDGLVFDIISSSATGSTCATRRASWLLSSCARTGWCSTSSDKQQCDRFHMCDETGKLAAEFLCE